MSRPNQLAAAMTITVLTPCVRRYIVHGLFCGTVAG
jgi:hypothetical protein